MVLKKFALIFALIVALEIGKIIVANVTAGWEEAQKKTHIFVTNVGGETKKVIAVK